MPASPVTAYLSLGSNLGERREQLRRACAALENSGVRLRQISSLYETAPVDFVEQDWFLNCVLEIETTLEPLELLREMQRIEQKLRRRRERPKGPRTIDIDLLLYGDSVLNLPELVVPHPQMTRRRFVLEPLLEIAPALVVPKTAKTVQELWQQLADSSAVQRLEERWYR
ncbi:MAG: 2-amino-4-hydroxy-6-hydroxymethyldihydropteridine diphosphokinase [Acidobacteria bacterium]|nr:2-amino-4-hydroxy-6-hydroxymethyldihydropteridine diphosphokinase [Acidobacteriota bacterium]